MTTETTVSDGLKRRTNADGTTTWAARCKDLNRKDQYRTFTTRRDAEAWLNSIRTAKHQGVNPSPQAGRQTFDAWAQEYVTTKRLAHREATSKSMEGHLDRYFLPAFGGRRLGAITPKDVQAFVHSMVARGLAPGTVRQSYTWLRAMFTAAVRTKTLGESPCVGIVLPEAPPKRTEAMSPAVVEGLIHAINPRYSAMVLLAARTGMRQGEVLGLRWAHVNVEARTIKVDEQFIQGAVRDLRPSPLKTKKSYRTLPVGREVIDALIRHRMKYGMGSVEGANDLVFSSATGGPVGHNAFRAAWRPMQGRFNLAKGEGMHQLRHFAGSAMMAGGMSPAKVRDYLGHSSLKELDTYCHRFADDTGDDLRNVMDAVFAPKVPALAVVR